ncbi:hypothetical protein [uncultured Ruminococcus sp.]|uniref:hypothetical protein n=1 Tax=uncultured Ruminococcus sp. TaxID=165186 RepID=UPI00262F8970|nr:hypothetical protein [uncultured Ruminococcus sp.]
MAYCIVCGKETDNGTTCPECAAKAAEAQQEAVPAETAIQPEMIQPEAVQTVAAVPKVKKKVNKAIVALLSLLGVFAVMTAVVIGIII